MSRAGYLQALLETPKDKVALGLRLVFAGVMLPHGAQHALGWLGGYGYTGTHHWMTTDLGMPSILASLAIIGELVAPLLLAVGLGGRFAAAILGTILAVAATTHSANGFFMNWAGSQRGEGFEYHLLGVAVAAAIIVKGSGAFSLDRVLARVRRDAPMMPGAECELGAP